MEKMICVLCEQPVMVTDEQRKRFDAFVCSRCHDKTRAQIAAQMGDEHANFFAAQQPVEINGKRCGISNVRVVG
jgi:hypothetical protein